jgi:DNA-binding response OmpR family regulator
MGSLLSSKILVVDDEMHIRELARLYLTREGYEVEGVGDGDQAMARFAQLKPDLVILDIMLPGIDGLTICKEIRKVSQVPIIMLTARDEVTDKVVGLEVGADDYLTKPFSTEELVARVRALLRRPAILQASNPEFAGLQILPAAASMKNGDESVTLAPAELQIMLTLVRAEGRTVRRPALELAGWGLADAVTPNALDVALHRLRKKLAAIDSAVQLVNVRGQGYALQADDKP